MQDPIYDLPEDAQPSPPHIRLYSRPNILLGTVFGGLLLGGYLLAENFRLLGDKDRAIKTWVGTILLIAVYVFVRSHYPHLPNLIYWILYVLLANYIFKEYQHDQVEQHQENGGQMYDGMRVFIAILIELGVVVALVILVAIVKTLISY